MKFILKKEYYTKNGYKIYGQEQVIDDDFSIGDYYISEEKFTSCYKEENDKITYGKEQKCDP